MKTKSHGHLVGALFRRKKFRYKTVETFNLTILLNIRVSKWWTGKHKNLVIFIAVLFLRACVSPLYMCVKSGVHVWTVQGPVQCTHKDKGWKYVLLWNYQNDKLVCFVVKQSKLQVCIWQLKGRGGKCKLTKVQVYCRQYRCTVDSTGVLSTVKIIQIKSLYVLIWN